MPTHYKERFQKTTIQCYRCVLYCTPVQIIARNTNLTYTEEMADPNSDAFRDVESAHCKEVQYDWYYYL